MTPENILRTSSENGLNMEFISNILFQGSITFQGYYFHTFFLMFQ